MVITYPEQPEFFYRNNNNLKVNFMEERMLKEFAKEIETLKKIIEGYISQNEVLASMELDSLSLKMSGAGSDEEGRNDANGSSTFTTTSSPAAMSCKICRDSRGNAYCYFGRGDCPPR